MTGALPRESRRERQTTDTVLMVRPAHCFPNPQTAGSNAFQQAAMAAPEAELLAGARAEFDAFVATLRGRGVTVVVTEDTPDPPTPDAVFPNNWVSFHEDGTVVLYPLLAENRRAEVRLDLLDLLERGGHFRRRRLLDLRDQEGAGHFLEGTGSLVLDRAHRVAYACLSPRTSPRALAAFGEALGYATVAFHARDRSGVPVYHSNVVMSVGERLAVACLDAIADAAERRAVTERLAEDGHELVAITLAQMERFAGNCLQLRAADGQRLLVLSAQARRALDAGQVAALERHGELVSADLDTIEACGGGSARCMLAEVFAPPA